MKRIIILGVMVIMILSLAACVKEVVEPEDGELAAEEQDYMSKISVFIDTGEGVINTWNELIAEADKLSAKDIYAAIRFDFDYKDTAEYKEFMLESYTLTTQAEVDDFRQRLAISSKAYHSNMLACCLSSMQFSSEVEKIGYSPFVIISSDSLEVLCEDIIIFAKSQNVKSIEVSQKAAWGL